MKTSSGLVTLALVLAANARTFTVKNSCSFTVWPAIFTDLNVGTAIPNQPTGWSAAPGSSVSFTVPDNWASGRIWGRQGCTFDANGQGNCASGQCYGGLLCDAHAGIGATPASLAEFTLGGSGPGADWYDVSLVDGFNLPIAVTPSASSCHEASCPVNLNAICPAELQYNNAGIVAGCKTACGAGLAPDPNNSPNCCTGSHGTQPTCPSSGVEYYSFFKNNCPDSYAYAYDENSGTALWQCDGTLRSNYLIEFCPNGSTPPPPPPPPPSGGAGPVHPNGNTAKCLDVQSAVFANGTPVQIYDCNGTPAQQWTITGGKVQAAGTNFCLDAGSAPANGVAMKIWTCYDNLPAQEWTYTSAHNLQLQTGNQCLDLTNGSTANGNILQTWTCTAGNTNQVWTQ